MYVVMRQLFAEVAMMEVEEIGDRQGKLCKIGVLK